ncbi:hypothetical protein C4588_05750 [Candidatus Parcubacteria bacterium]|nr:MAG: hypothetical protein C4588_05750 [Candidatus Parcubacteria bacterium]
MGISDQEKSPKVFEFLDNYFSIMDQASVSEKSIFSDENAKEKHESILMYAFRKYRAASYHLERVEQLKVDTISNTDTDLLSNEHLPNGAKVKISIIRSADHFIYELAAFFAAVKSSIDFLATACSEYIKGIVTDSIRTFIKGVDKNRKGHIFDVIKKHLLWLKEIREYRHHLVHRMVITASVGHETHKCEHLVKKINYPVVVPKSTPAYFPDTRRSRMLREEMNYLDCIMSESKVKYSDGTQEIVEFSIKYSPSRDFIEISELMTSHLHQLEAFFCDIIVELKNMNFCAIKLQ